MRISDWSSDVCSSDLVHGGGGSRADRRLAAAGVHGERRGPSGRPRGASQRPLLPHLCKEQILRAFLRPLAGHAVHRELHRFPVDNPARHSGRKEPELSLTNRLDQTTPPTAPRSKSFEIGKTNV